MRERSIKTALVLGALVAAASTRAGAEPAAPDSAMIIPGGSEGATLKDMTVEGEDKIRIEFERPALDLGMDPRSAPGLDWDHRRDVIGRTDVRFDTPLLAASAGRHSPYLGCPWFDRFATAPVARFHPEVDGVDRWKLTVANSRGETVAEFKGQGKVPKEIPWNGLTAGGAPAMPGLVYSYVFEAFDKAGNKRNFMGDGFELPPYRVQTDGNLLLLFAAGDMGSDPSRPSGLLMEAASWINQTGSPDRPVQIEAKARTFDQARALADGVMRGLDGRVLGDPRRLQPLTAVEPNAPESGTVTIRMGTAPAAPASKPASGK
jgi:hypothetical protein